MTTAVARGGGPTATGRLAVVSTARDDVCVRRLLIVRHAKSDWADRSLTDHDRPLAPRGVEALPRMRSHLAGRDSPDLVLCSSARRTLDTLDGIRPVLDGDVEIRVEDDLYGADAWSLVDRLRRVADDVTTVMLVGHNPGLHDLAVELASGSGAEGVAWEQLVTKFPTGAIATLTVDTSWAGIGTGDASLDDLFTPRPPR